MEGKSSSKKCLQAKEKHSKKIKKSKKRKWASRETNKLLRLVKQNGPKWTFISKRMLSRSPKQCMQKFYNLTSVQKKGRWVISEDNLVKKWVEETGPFKWAECAKQIEGRCGKQCRERWLNFLDPSINRAKWNAREQTLLFELMLRFGSSWAQISRYIQGRSENLVKNFFYCSLRMVRSSLYFKLLKLFLFNFKLSEKGNLRKNINILYRHLVQF